MKEFKSVDEILDFAITAEQEAVDFYSDLASRSKNAQIKKVFVEFAGEEMRHKSRLLAIKEEKTLKLPDEKVRDMKIADYLVDVAPMPDMTYGEALILAMKKEKNAFRLYTYLSEEASATLISAQGISYIGALFFLGGALETLGQRSYYRSAYAISVVGLLLLGLTSRLPALWLGAVVLGLGLGIVKRMTARPIRAPCR